MIWTHCGCGHRIERHYISSGNQRHGPCKEPGCACPSFIEKEAAQAKAGSKSRSSGTG